MPTMQPDEIRTERLILRPLASTDSDSVYAIRSDPRVFYWTEAQNREQSDAWLKVRLGSDKSMVYTVSLLPFDTESTSPTAASQNTPQIIGLTGAHNLPEVGYIFRPSSWNHGYATEALRAWIEMYWCRYPDGHEMLEGEEKGILKAITGPGGEASRGVLRKSGFRWYGEEVAEDERKGAKEMDLTVVLVEMRLQRPGTEG